MSYILALDQGTTSSRALLLDTAGAVVAVAHRSFQQYFPHNGWVEHDPEEIWQTTLEVAREVLATSAVAASQVLALGITNQRETTCVWDKNTGKPVYPAIVWQDRRTAERCEALRREGLEKGIAHNTGLLLDPYFSATKLAWILETVPGVRERAERGDCLFGTIDTFLLWHLTGRKAHATDATNASRTMLFNIHTQEWDEELLTLFQIPRKMLPEVKDSAAFFGTTEPALLGHAWPITAMIGDQQAATVGQACIEPGMVKSTYGTGCFMVVNTGSEAILSEHRLLTTTAYRLKGKPTYALEGSIFVAGAAIQWLRDGLQLFAKAEETEKLAQSVPNNGGVVLVPAFTGLGAPYWDANARGAIWGITRDTQVGHIVRATLEAICFQTRDLLEAIFQDRGQPVQTLRIDGGMVSNGWFNQTLSDTLGVTVARPKVHETTALGAGFLAGLGAGIFKELSEVKSFWQSCSEYTPHPGEVAREQGYAQWKKAISRTLSDTI